jgi:signal-transduction protein with cAMP-binding, CBS, and nucleotidyltransferase domain
MARALTLDDNKLYKAKWRNFELFKELDEDDMQQCIDAMKVRSYNLGDTIIKRGTIGTTMFFIDLGTARAEIR